MAVYTNLFCELRSLAEQAQMEEDAESLEYVKSALETIGHPYEESHFLWPLL